MKNVLYIGPYRQNDTYGEISRQFINSLKISNNITSVPIYYTGDIISQYHNTSLEKKNSINFDCMIQHCLPGDFFRNKHHGKNIGIVSIDTYDWKNNYSSIANLNTMDEIWVSSNAEKNILQKSGLKSNIKVIYPSIDTNLVQKDNTIISLNSKYNNTFKFYTIIDDILKDDLKSLIIAFNLAFNFYDNVSLIIKSKIKDLEKHIQEIKQLIGFKHKFIKELILPPNFDTTHSAMTLHNTGDCFISCKNADFFNPRLIEALVCGKTPIVNQNTPAAEFITKENGFLVKSHKYPFLQTTKILPDTYDFYRANQYSYKIDIYDLINSLQSVYQLWKQDKSKLNNLSNNGKLQIENFTDLYVSNTLCL
jgi:hypothetical protein